MLNFFSFVLLHRFKQLFFLSASDRLQVMIVLISNFVFLSFWFFFFKRFQSLKGWTFQDMIMLYSIVSTSNGLSCILFSGARDVAKCYTDHMLDIFIRRPHPAVLHLITSRSSISGFGDIFTGIFYLILMQFYHVNFSFLFWLLSIVLGGLLITSFALLTGCMIFIFKRSELIGKQLQQLLLTFSNYPKSIYPDFMRIILATIIPTMILAYWPVTYIQNQNVNLAILAGFIVISFCALSLLVFQTCIRYYNS